MLSKSFVFLSCLSLSAAVLAGEPNGTWYTHVYLKTFYTGKYLFAHNQDSTKGGYLEWEAPLDHNADNPLGSPQLPSVGPVHLSTVINARYPKSNTGGDYTESYNFYASDGSYSIPEAVIIGVNQDVYSPIPQHVCLISDDGNSFAKGKLDPKLKDYFHFESSLTQSGDHNLSCTLTLWLDARFLNAYLINRTNYTCEAVSDPTGNPIPQAKNCVASQAPTVLSFQGNDGPTAVNLDNKATPVTFSRIGYLDKNPDADNPNDANKSEGSVLMLSLAKTSYDHLVTNQLYYAVYKKSADGKNVASIFLSSNDPAKS